MSESQGPAREETLIDALRNFIKEVSMEWCDMCGFKRPEFGVEGPAHAPDCPVTVAERAISNFADAGAKSVVAAPQPHGLHSRLLACGCYPCDFHQAELESRLAGAAALPSADQAAKIVIEEINSSTGPTGGWLDSPKAVCAEIVARLHGANKRELPSPPVPPVQTKKEK